MKIINFRFFPILCLYLVSGIGIGYFFWYNSTALFVAGALALLAIAAVILFRKRLISSVTYIIMFCAFIVGLFMTAGYVHTAAYGIKDERIVADIRVNYVSQEENAIKVSFTSEEISGNAKLYYSEEINFEIGDKLNALINIETVSVIEENYTLNNSYFLLDEKYEGRILDIYEYKVGALTFTEHIRSSLDEGLSVLQDDRGVAYALLTGDKYAIADEQYDEYKNSGLAHILAVSGLHVSIIAAAVIFLLKKFKVNRYLTLAVVSVTLFLYAMLCDFSPSVVRAFIMTTVFLLADCTGRETDLLSSTCFAAVILLLISPFNIFNIGFLLSFGAVIAIAVLHPILKNLFKWVPSFLRDLVSISFAVNIFTFPIMAEVFGSVSIVFLLANVLVLPIMSVGYTLLVAGGVIFLVTKLSFVLYPGGLFVSYLNIIAHEVANLPFAIITVPAMGILALEFYFLIFLFSNFVMVKLRNKFITAGISAAVFLPIMLLV